MQSIEVRPAHVLVFSWQGQPDKSAVLAALIGVEVIDANQIEVFAAENIAAMGLTAYLAEGYGIDPAELTDDADNLDRFSGTVVVVSARAFPADTTVTPGAGLTLIGQFFEAGTIPTAPKPLESESAKGTVPATPKKAAKSDARVGGMVALAVLVFLALFVVFFVWSAG